MATAKPDDVFRQVVKTVAERLRLSGFVRSGMLLRLMESESCGLIGFQRSTQSSRERILFTVNVGIVYGSLLDDAPDSLPKTRVMDAHVRLRLGMLLPSCSDKWWEINKFTDSSALADELIGLALSKAVPYIHRYLVTDTVVEMWESGQSPGLTSGQRDRFLAILKAKRQGGAG